MGEEKMSRNDVEMAAPKLKIKKLKAQRTELRG
jgi:hypothetical protein